MLAARSDAKALQHRYSTSVPLIQVRELCLDVTHYLKRYVFTARPLESAVHIWSKRT